MADEITTLGLGVDTSQVKSANKDLDQLADSANQAGSAAEAMRRALMGAAQATQAAVARLESIVKDSASATLTLADAMGKANGSNKELAASTKQVGDAGERLLDSLRDQVATYNLSVDGLLRYRAAQAGVADTAAPLILQLQNQRAAQKLAAEAATAEANAQRQAAQEKQAAQRSQAGFLESLKQQAETSGMTATDVLRYRAAMLGVSSEADGYIKRIDAANDKTRTYGAGMKLTAYEAQQMSFQLNDLFVQIASGQSPITALIQQGSQLTGTFGGFANTFKALSTVFTVSRLALGGTAAAVAAVAAASYRGSQDSIEFRRSLVLTANAAGLTEGGFRALIRTTADAADASVGASREIAQGLASSGQLSGDALEKTSIAAALFSKVTGQSAEEVVRNFGSVSDNVSAFAEKTNKSYNYLTAEQLKYVKQLEDQQRGDEAIVLVMTALIDRLQRAAKEVGALESAWQSLSKWVSRVWENGKRAGQELTVYDRIRQNLELIASIENGSEGRTRAGQNRIAALQAQNAALSKQRDISEGNARAQADAVELDRTRKILNDQIAVSKGRQARYDKAMEDANKLADKAQATPEQRAALLKGVRDQFDPGIAAAQSAASVQSIQRTLQTLTAAYQDAESILDATRQAGLISDREVYEAKRAFIELNRQAQVKALTDENTALAAASRRENLTTAERIGLQGQIKGNLEQIAQINGKAAASATILGLQQSSAAQAAKRAYEEARQSAQDYLDTLTRAQNRELALMGKGTAERQREQGRNQIDDRYEQQLRSLENNKVQLELEGKFTEEARNKYEQQVSIIKEFRAKAIVEWDSYYEKRRKKEQDATVGAKEALANYLESTRNVAKTTEDAFTNAFRSLEDTLAEFFKTGKLNFKGFIDSILTELARVEAKKAAGSILGWLGDSFPSIFGGSKSDPSALGGAPSLPDILRGRRAIGGPVSAGGIYRINENNRPEIANFGGKDYLLTGGQSGTVKPAGEASGGHTFQFNIGQGVTRNEVAALIPTIVKQVEAVVTQKSRRGAVLGG